MAQALVFGNLTKSCLVIGLCFALVKPSSVFAQEDASWSEVLQQSEIEGSVQGSSSVTRDDSLHRRALTVPKGLERDVLFWERVFGEFTPEQCAFHDEWHLDVVYDVEEIPWLRNGKKNHHLQRHLKSIRTALDNIKSRGRPLGAYETKIYGAVPERLRTRSFFADAADRVRCQRGVDFESSIARSQKYIPMIKRMLRAKGLPEDLAYLPHLESGFQVSATSRAGARGLWQFMPHTARSEGLKVRRGNDWRLDPVKSTDAATDYLASIYLRVKSWDLAITSYNYGPNGVMRAIRKFGPDYMTIRSEHKTKIFGFAARNYYPSFLAVRNVAKKSEIKDSDSYRATVAEDDDKIVRSMSF